MKNIALAFSGGGFRAACFSQGSLHTFTIFPIPIEWLQNAFFKE